MADIVYNLLSGSELRVTTRLTPTVVLDGSGALDGPPNPLWKWLQPEVQLWRNGALVTTVAPYGRPTPPDYWSWLAVALLGALVGLVYLRSR